MKKGQRPRVWREVKVECLKCHTKADRYVRERIPDLPALVDDHVGQWWCEVCKDTPGSIVRQVY